MSTMKTLAMWRYIACFVLTMHTACTTLPPSQTVAVPGASPRMLHIQLTSGLKWTPYSPQELADPLIQRAIAQCERAGIEHCREQPEPIDARTQFVQGQDKQGLIVVALQGLEPARTYEVQWRLFTPEGQLQARMAMPPNIASTPLVVYWFTINPSALLVGRWRVEIVVNGRMEAERFFEIVPRVQSPFSVGRALIDREESLHARFCWQRLLHVREDKA